MYRRWYLAILVAGLALAIGASIATAREPQPPEAVRTAHILTAQASACVNKLAPPVRLWGHVLDAQGAVQPGLYVQVLRSNGGVLSQARADANGRYEFRSLPAGPYTLRILDKGGRPWQVINVQVTPNEAGAVERNLVLTAPPQAAGGGKRVIMQTGHITGVVTAADTGLPLENIYVEARDAVSGGWGGSASTDSQGQYSLDYLPSGTYIVMFEDFSLGIYLSQWYDHKSDENSATPVNVTDGAVTPNINAALVRGGQIKGKVTAADGGAPLADVNIWASGECYDYGYAATQADGTYTITGLFTDSYRVDFSPPSSGAAAGYIGQDYPTAVVVTAPNVIDNINAALEHGGRISGTVTAADGGAGLQNVQVEVYNDTGDWAGYASTDAKGHYTTGGLPTGNYKVKFSASSYGPSAPYAWKYYNDKTTQSAADTVSLTAPNVVHNINAVLERGARLTGRVKAADTSLPLNAYVYVYDDTGIQVRYTSANVSGVYTTAGLLSGSYKVEFVPSGSGSSYPYTRQYYNDKPDRDTADAVSVTAPNLVPGIDAALARGGQISGTVTAANTGLPLENVYVAVYDSQGHWAASTWTDERGHYLTPGVPTGGYRVRFDGLTDCKTKTCYEGEYYNDKTSLALADVVNVTAPSVTKNINAALGVCKRTYKVYLPVVLK